MAESIKGINVVIGAETTGLQKALSDVNKQARDIQNELKQVEKLLKLDPSNTELVAQKQKLLGEAISATREKLDRLKAAQEQVNQQFAAGEISEGQYRAFQREIVATEQELGRLESALAGTNLAAGDSDLSLESLAATMESASQRMMSVGTALSVGVTAPIVAIGAAAMATGLQFEQASNTIRKATGATNEALTGLEQSYNNVYKQTTAGSDQVVAAISLLNTRTGETGESLEALALAELRLASMTGQEINQSLDLTTKMFGDWSIATDDQVNALDKLWRASQASGVSTNELAGTLKQYGAPLRALNFSFEESAALLAKWQKEGVNTELVLGGMKIALGNFAEAGLEPKVALEDLIAKIQALGPGAEATGLAMDAFGKRAGPDMAAAILEGRFSFQEMLDAIENGTDTLAIAAADTATFAGKLKILQHNAESALEPIGKILVDTLNEQGIPILMAAKETVIALSNAFQELSPTAQKAIVAISAGLAAIGPTLLALSKAMSWLGGAIEAIAAAGGLAGIATAAAPIAAVVAAVVALGAAIAGVWADSEAFRTTISGAFDTIGTAIDQVKGNISGMFEGGGGFEALQVGLDALIVGIQTTFLPIWEIIKGVVGGTIAFIVGIFSGIWQAIDMVVAKATELWTSFAQSETGRAALDAIKSAVETMQTKFAEFKAFLDPIVDKFIEIAGVVGEFVGKAALLTGLVIILAPIAIAIGLVVAAVYLLVSAWDLLVAGASLVADAFEVVKTAVEGVAAAIADKLQPVTSVVDGIWETIKGNAQTAWNAITLVVTGTIPALITALGNALQPAITAVGEVWTDIQNDVAGKWGEISGAVDEAIGVLIEAAVTTFDPIVTEVSDIWQDVQEAIETPINAAYTTVTDVIDDIIQAFEDMVIPHFSLELPHISVSTAYTDVAGTPVPVPSFDVEWYGSGGIFNDPSIIGVGEAGPEAVIPLNRLAGIVEQAIGTAGRSIVQNLTINSPAPMSAADIARKTRQVSRQLALEWQV